MKPMTPRARASARRAGPYARKLRRPKAQRPGRPSPVELKRRKAKVAKVATRLFVQHGYAATSLVNIAKAANVSTLTLYAHFGGKEALFKAVVTAREEGAVRRPPSVRDANSLQDGVMQIARYVYDVWFQPRARDLMRLSIAEGRRFPGFLADLTQRAVTQVRQSVACMFEELTVGGLAPKCDVAASASIFVDLILGTTPVLVYAGLASAELPEADLEEKVKLFILGRFGPAVAKRARPQWRDNAPKSAPP